MVHADIQRNLHTVFEGGILPNMVYISKQEIDHKKLSRPLHHHESLCELIFVHKGQGSYQVGTEIYPLESGTIAFYNQMDLHELSSSTNMELGHYCLGINNLHLKGLPKNHLVPAGGPHIKKAGSLFPYLLETCKQIYDLEEMNIAGKIASQLLCATLVVIASQLESFPQGFDTKDEDEIFVASILSYLNSHFDQDLNLEQLADHFNCSATTISHSFKKATGTTPMKYVIRRRIGLAQTLLISTDLTATQIATMVGYDNTNYFSTLFAKTVGMTPIKYRSFYLKKLKGQRDQS